MTKRYMGRNKGFWIGKVIELPTYIKTYQGEMKYRMKVQVAHEYNDLTCSVFFTKNTYQAIQDNVCLESYVEIAGCWKAEDVFDEKQQKKVKKQYIEASTVLIVKHENKPFQQVEIEGVLVKKLTKRKWKKDGKLMVNGKGNPVPLKDKSGKLLYTIRTGRDGRVLNDYTIACNIEEENGKVVTHYLPCVSYDKEAKKIAYQIDIGEALTGSGYIKMRKNEKDEKPIYEVILTNIEKVS